MFNRGQKVVCVDDKAEPAVLAMYQDWPKEGRTYTVRRAFIGRADAHSRGANDWNSATARILLMELINDRDPGCNPALPYEEAELGFHPRRFVPLEEIKQREGAERDAAFAEYLEKEKADAWIEENVPPDGVEFPEPETDAPKRKKPQTQPA